MSGAWLGFIKFVLTLLVGISFVGTIGFILGGWPSAILGGVVGALATLYGIRDLMIRSRAGR